MVAIDLRSGMDVDRTVELSRRRTLAVRVTSPAGVVAECAVVATPWSEVQQAPHAWVRHHAVATSLDDGRIEFTRLGDRRYLLRAVVAGFAPASIVVDAAVVSPDHPIDLSVRTGFPVTLRSGSERRGTVDVVIARSDRVPVWADDVRGSVELLLEPGRYVMSVDAGADAVEEPGQTDIKRAGQHGQPVGTRLRAVVLPCLNGGNLDAEAARQLGNGKPRCIAGTQHAPAHGVVIGDVGIDRGGVGHR